MATYEVTFDTAGLNDFARELRAEIDRLSRSADAAFVADVIEDVLDRTRPGEVQAGTAGAGVLRVALNPTDRERRLLGALRAWEGGDHFVFEGHVYKRTEDGLTKEPVR